MKSNMIPEKCPQTKKKDCPVCGKYLGWMDLNDVGRSPTAEEWLECCKTIQARHDGLLKLNDTRQVAVTKIHINRPSGYYIGQVRAPGHKLWETVTGRCKSAPAAMAACMKKFEGMKRARVLFVTVDGWYEPDVVMECKY